MQWLYSEKLVLKELDDSEFDDFEELKTQKGDSENLTELWVLADKFGMPCLQNFALKSIDDISMKKRVVTVSTFPYIYENTAPDSCLRRYMVGLMAKCAVVDADWFAGAIDYIPKEMLADFALLMIRKFMGLEKNDFEISDYLVKDD
jgi:hypothetical protein